MPVRFTWHGERVVGNIRKELSRRIERCGQDTRTELVRNLKRSGKGYSNGTASNVSRPGQYPTSIRGLLWRSIFSEMVDEGTARVGVDSMSPAAKYAKRLEEGGIIEAHGKLLAIPISPQAKAHSYNGGPRSLGIPLVRIRRPGKTMLLVEIKGGSKSRKAWVIHYVLSPKVTILARPYLARTVMDMIPRYKAILEAPFQP